MNKPANIVMTTGRNLAGDALARNLYPTLIAALAEIIFNGLDAATIRGVTPEITIRFWAPGEHPLSPDGPAISVLDNGTGLTPRALAGYCKVGESEHVNKVGIHGKHGVGKLAPFALAPKENATFYLTTNTDEYTWMYHLASDVFAAGGFEPIQVVERIGLPQKGPFTEILVPNFQGGMTIESLLKELPSILPFRPWKVTVQGREVKPRTLKFKEVLQTKDIPLFKGPVGIELGVAEITSEGDGVLLVDSGSKRSVGDLLTMPPVVRRALDPILLHPKLVGQILVPDLERQSAVSRSGLKAEYWTSSQGQKLIEVLLAFVVPVAQKLLKDEVSPKEGIRKVVTQLGPVFAKGFGPPDLGGFGSKNKGTSEPKGSSGGRPTSRPNQKPAERNSQPSKAGSGSKLEGVFVRVEDVTYQILEFSTQSEVPATVRGNTIVINTNHATVRGLDSRASRATLETTVDMILWAHLVATRPWDHDVIKSFYQLRVRAFAS